MTDASKKGLSGGAVFVIVIAIMFGMHLCSSGSSGGSDYPPDYEICQDNRGTYVC